MEKKIKRCEYCGAEFEVKAPNHKYCSLKCQHKADRVLHNEADESKAIDMVSRCGDDWGYVGGYTGSDGYMVIRHKPCGSEMRKSSQTVRKGRKLYCECCAENEKLAKEKHKSSQKEVKRLRRPIKKIKMETLKECAVCGSFYFGSRRKYCSDECSRKVLNRYSTDRKEIKRKKARTKHSSEITVQSLYNRDNGICWICGGKCDINADGNSNEYPSVDHILPVSLGGTDEWNNVRLAHRICNSLRGNKPAKIPPTSKAALI